MHPRRLRQFTNAPFLSISVFVLISLAVLQTSVLSSESPARPESLGQPNDRTMREDTDASPTTSTSISGQRAAVCYKILLISPICSKSHNQVYSVLAEALASRCHEVTILISHPAKVKEPGVRQLSSPTYRALSEEAFLYRLKQIPPFSVWNVAKNIWGKMQMAPSICERFLADPLTQRMLKDDIEQYDYILFSPHLVEECALAFVHLHRKRFGTPWGFIFITVPFPWVEEAMGNPALSSTYPSHNLNFGDRMNFWERAVNLVYGKFFLWSRLYWSYPRVEAVLRRDFDPDIGSLAQLEKTSSMFMVNIDEGLFFYPQPTTPQTIFVGGLHCKEPQALPKELDDWFAGSGDNGVVFFSLGTFLKGEDFPATYREEFVKAFSHLKQRVLWRWDGPPIPNLPANVKTMEWVPQQDVLGHRKCKAFISHGGMMGIQEAAYHGVPIVGFPMGADQHLNLAKVASSGAGLKFDWANVSSNVIVRAVEEVINGSSFQESVKKRKALLRDQLQSPLERAVWWIEFMIRHKGAEHLRPAARDMEWYQVYLLDVWIFFAFLGVIVASVSFFMCRMCYCRRVKAVDSSNRKATLPSGFTPRTYSRYSVKKRV